MDLSWRIFVRNIRAAHRKSVLGLIWLVLPPIINTAVWVLLNSTGVISFGGTGVVAYPIFALTGILIWQAFLDALQTPFNVMQAFENIIKSLFFPRGALLGAAVLEVIFNAGIRVVLITVGLMVFQVYSGFSVILFFVPLAVLLVLGFAINLWLLPFFLLYKDVGRLLGFATQFIFFLTPIIYNLPDDGSLFSRLAYLNPVTPPLLACRDLLLTGTTLHWKGTIVVMIVAIFLLVSGLRIFRLTCERIIERI